MFVGETERVLLAWWSAAVLCSCFSFFKPHRCIFVLYFTSSENLHVYSPQQSWKILLFGAINLICIGFLLMWCSSTNSIGRWLSCNEASNSYTVFLHTRSSRVLQIKALRILELDDWEARLEVASFSFAMVTVEAFLAERCARISRLLVVFFYVASSVYKTEKTEF